MAISDKLQQIGNGFEKSLFSAFPFLLVIDQKSGRIVHVIETNGKMPDEIREALIGKTFRELGWWIDEKECDQFFRILDREGRVSRYKAGIVPQKMVQRTVLLSAEPMVLGNEKFLLVFGNDITDLNKNREEVKALAARTEEMSIALKVLMERREQDHSEYEEQLLYNIKSLVFPHLERLKEKRLSQDQMAVLTIAESNLRQILSPSLKRLTSVYSELTPREIEVAELIRDGKSTKEIATLLSMAEKTVSFHRLNIRTKLGISSRKVNLYSFLASLT